MTLNTLAGPVTCYHAAAVAAVARPLRVEIVKVAPGFRGTLGRGKTGNSAENFPCRDVTPLTAMVGLVFTISTTLTEV